MILLRAVGDTIPPPPLVSCILMAMIGREGSALQCFRFSCMLSCDKSMSQKYTACLLHEQLKVSQLAILVYFLDKITHTYPVWEGYV